MFGIFKLHYVSLKLQGDIPCFKFKKHSDMIDFIDEKCINRIGKVVWLLAKSDLKDVFVSESHISIQDFLKNKYCWQTTGDYFFQEYSSFEEAYKVALDMKEESPLCYSDVSKSTFKVGDNVKWRGMDLIVVELGIGEILIATSENVDDENYNDWWVGTQYVC